MTAIKEFTKDKLKIKIYDSRVAMGEEAAREAACEMKKLLAEKDELNIIFAAAPSQNEFLEALTADKDIQWEKINAFHMDEYVNLDPNAPQGFGNFLRKRLFEKVGFKSVNYLNGNATDIVAECQRYSELLNQYPADIVCMGIGENGHIAFNDPHVAFFDDPQIVKMVLLDDKCRTQQVNDCCFNSLNQVPTHAITLTIPALVAGKHIFCMVPGPTKADAVQKTILGEITEDCPASILRIHEDATLYLDQDSAGELL